MKEKIKSKFISEFLLPDYEGYFINKYFFIYFIFFVEKAIVYNFKIKNAQANYNVMLNKKCIRFYHNFKVDWLNEVDNLCFKFTAMYVRLVSTINDFKKNIYIKKNLSQSTNYA